MNRLDFQIILLPFMLLIFLFSCERNKSPVCTIVAPENNTETKQGTTMIIDVEAYDPDGSISSVKFYIDSNLIYSTPNSPYSYEWTTESATLGEHMLRVTAIDQEGAEDSDECIFSIIDQLQWEQKELEEYLQNHGITEEPTASGLYYLPLIEGIGDPVAIYDFVDFEYVVKLLDGTVLFTSYEDTARTNNIYQDDYLYGPVRFQVGFTHIPGLDEGLTYMREGGRAMLILPSFINGFGGVATDRSPPYSTHIYTVDLIHAFSDPVSFEQEQISLYLIEHQIDSFVVTNSGLYYIEKFGGEGDLIKNGDNVSAWYTGTFLDGRVFASNLDGQAFTIQVPATGFIAAWDEALKLMRKGTQAKIIAPYDLAYGETGYGSIPPYMTLVFDMEITDVR